MSTIGFVVFGGCGAASDNGVPVRSEPCVPATDIAADVRWAGTAVTVAAADDRFVPPCIEVGTQGEVTVVVRNEGRHPHNFTVAGGAAVAVDAGQVGFATVTVGEAGVGFTCTIHPGMDGRFVVAG